MPDSLPSPSDISVSLNVPNLRPHLPTPSELQVTPGQLYPPVHTQGGYNENRGQLFQSSSLHGMRSPGGLYGNGLFNQNYGFLTPPPGMGAVYPGLSNVQSANWQPNPSAEIPARQTLTRRNSMPQLGTAEQLLTPHEPGELIQQVMQETLAAPVAHQNPRNSIFKTRFQLTRALILHRRRWQAHRVAVIKGKFKIRPLIRKQGLNWNFWRD